MLNGKKIIVVMPAYNAEKTLQKTYDEIPKDIVDNIVLVDDGSKDKTAELSKELGIITIIHQKNRGYGGNQKTCYKTALELGADIVIMVHPDYQYTPKLIVSLSSMIAYGEFDAAFGSRILGSGALKGGMPIYKYIANRLLTLFENLMFREKLSEYHTGYRAFSKELLTTLSFEHNSEDFLFDNQMIAQIFWNKFKIGEVTCPTKYFKGASSISFKRSCIYGIGVLKTSIEYRLALLGLGKPKYLADINHGA